MRDRSLILGLGGLSAIRPEDIERNNELLAWLIKSSVEEVFTGFMHGIPITTLRGERIAECDSFDYLFDRVLPEDQLGELRNVRHIIHQFLNSSISEFYIKSLNHNEYGINIDYMLMNRSNMVISCSVYPM